MEFEKEDSETDSSYCSGSLDTIAHQAACCICQWFDCSGVPTSDTLEALDLPNFPTRKEIKENLKAYISELKKIEN